MSFNVDEIYNEVIKKYGNNKRLAHILGVANTAKSLAYIFGLDETKAYIAGLLHDYIKYEPIEEMIEIINDEAIKERFKDAPQLYHGYASAKVAETKFGITDIDIINGIKYHTYGRCNMTLFEKILVIADFCEPSREYDSCIEVRKMLEKGEFDKAMYYCLKYTNESVLKHGNKPMDDQLLILEELKEKYYGTIRND